MLIRRLSNALLKYRFSKEAAEPQQVQRVRAPFGFTQVNCLVLHPIFYPNKGPELELYLAEEAVGLSKSLNWTLEKGPFWKEEYTQKIRISQGRNPIQARVENKEEELNAEGWELSGKAHLRNGEYIYLPFLQGTYDDGQMLVDLSSDSDDDLGHEWRNKIIRSSIAKSSLVKVKRIHSSTFFTKGKVAMLGEHIYDKKINAVFINHELTPLQTRNLEKVWTQYAKGEIATFRRSENPDDSDMATDAETDIEYEDAYVKVFDRFTMILQIFAKRSTQGVARQQIELSFLKFAKTKLVRSGSAFASLSSIFLGDLMMAKEVYLEVVSAKQRRALGKMSGSGESEIQIQRRKIDERIAKVRRQIEEEGLQRGKLKQKKLIHTVPRIALIGYTNAGKSQLLNCILQKEVVESKDLLFQTLSTTSKQIRLASGQKAIMLDTIGFITDLPHDLVESFKCTLEEVADADIVLHVRDISHPCSEQQKQVVLEVLQQLGFNEEFYSKKMIEVWNKIDLMRAPVDFNQIQQENYPIVPISALLNTNIKQLLQIMEDKSNLIMNKRPFKLRYNIDEHQQRLKWLFDNGNISGIKNEVHVTPVKKGDPTEIEYEVILDEITYNRYIATFTPELRVKKNKGMPPPNW
ncbi:unnamed protein product [Paramecium octaurelia]|uniref:Hflx-type G domain-containing protein n=1 Tax=Paramecium octaurelia TaxID=43137 RepID=A0A8S1T0T2_PAROT|nr:unnamed protein product [Paramecium octaurelia]